MNSAVLFCVLVIIYTVVALPPFDSEISDDASTSSESVISEETVGQPQSVDPIKIDFDRLQKLGMLIATVGEQVIPALLKSAVDKVESTEIELKNQQKDTINGLHLLQTLKKDIEDMKINV